MPSTEHETVHSPHPTREPRSRIAGPASPPIRERERADVDALLRELEGTRPSLSAPVLPAEEPRVEHDPKVPAWMLIVGGGMAFLLGMAAVVATFEWERSEARAQIDLADAHTKIVATRKPSVVVELAPFVITGDVPSTMAENDGTPPAMAPVTTEAPGREPAETSSTVAAAVPNATPATTPAMSVASTEAVGAFVAALAEPPAEPEDRVEDGRIASLPMSR
ncbi:MAG TPA: hypothetical protein RMH99_32765 [Sandaracinaceae bacterium LLY-WYZ-13_1]|nr:hypothetical protein [Sandaracinaceae bacterium LLY-WYZ-13_1]